MKFYLIFLSFFFLNKLSAQIPNYYPFVNGEELRYSVSYHLSFLWVDAAEVNFEVIDSNYLKKPAIFFLSTGYTKANYDWIFKVRNRFSSFTNYRILPLKYHRNTLEGSEKNNNLYYFDLYKKKIYSRIENKNTLKLDTLTYNKRIYDILSATYYLRTIPFQNYQKNDTIPVNTVMDNEIIKINVIYLGKEVITHRNEKSYPCYKFKTKGVAGSIFDDKSEVLVWVSQDENKIPLKIESEILVGSVIAYIQTIRNPKQTNTITKDFSKE